MIINSYITYKNLDFSNIDKTNNILATLLIERNADRINLYFNLDDKKTIMNDNEIIIGEVIEGFYNLYNLENGDLIYNVI